MSTKVFKAENTSVATIENCEDEPIHIPGSIQPHGFLLAVDKKTANVELCSANTDVFLSAAPEHILRKNYTETLPASLSGIIRTQLLGAGEDIPYTPFAASIGGRVFDCFGRHTPDYFFLECAPAHESPDQIYDLLLNTNDLFLLTDGNTGLYKLSTLIAQKIRNLIEYDRVMIYRFDEEYNGHVYAESVAEGADSFLNLHYPSTDIPKQARELYLKNLVRSIPDVAYAPVPMVTMRAGLARPEMMDMSNVHIRSVSSIHIQYLKNMGVGASFSISLIKDGRLWGLIACHNNKPGILSYSTQMKAYFLSQILSSQIGVQEIAENYKLLQLRETPLKKLMEYLERDENFIELHFVQSKEILSIVNAAGAALIYKNKVYVNGSTPPNEMIIRLRDWLQEQKINTFKTAELSASFPEAVACTDTASGLLHQEINGGGQTALFWFRPSLGKVIHWAGNPHKQENISALTPRSSFASWQELKHGVSLGWEQPELEIAFRFAYQLQRHIINISQIEDDLRYNQLKTQVAKANKELENINWISSHDLKEPLRKIQVFASMIESSNNSSNVAVIKKSIDRIQAAAIKMQVFIDDLLLYSRMTPSDVAYEPLNLKEVINEAATHFEEEKEQNLFELQIGELPAIRASRFQMSQLFTNLIDNAIKFRKDHHMQLISITSLQGTHEELKDKEKDRWHLIRIADTGVGFNMEMSQTIFDLFKRAHADTKYKGSGVGLSMCRKIMDNHGGKITAKSVENIGTEFTLFFPKKA